MYYRRIDDFIQGVPFDNTPGLINTPVEMVSAGSGDPTPLRFANTNAETWGADVAFGARLAGSLRVDAGIENVFDKLYVEHLAGYNRITGSDVAARARLPGAGRSAFIRLRWAFD